MIKIEKLNKVRGKKKAIEKNELVNILNQLKKGHELVFKDRTDFLLVDDFLNSQKIAYYIDNINKSIWL